VTGPLGTWKFGGGGYNGHRLWAMDATNVICKALFLLGATALITASVNRVASRPQSDPTRFDPKIGTSELDLFGVRLGSETKRTVAIYMGECSTCSMNSFDPSRVVLSNSVNLVFLIRGKGDVPWDKNRFRTIAVKTPPGMDPANFAWAPRAYVIESGRLTWIAKSPKDWPAGVSVREEGGKVH
jgi:hypothetical protein